MIEILAIGYSSESTQRELSKEYQTQQNLDGFQKSLRPLLWTKVASALKGLTFVLLMANLNNTK